MSVDNSELGIVQPLRPFSDMKRGGTLVAIEFPSLAKGIQPVRAYFLKDNPPVRETGGGHSHQVGHEWMYPIVGIIAIDLQQGTKTQRIALNTTCPVVLCVRPGIWYQVSGMSDGAVLGVLASTPYEQERNDYYEQSEPTALERL